MVDETIILSKQQIRDIYRSEYQLFQQQAIDCFNKNGDTNLPDETKTAIFKELTNLIVISNVYCVDFQYLLFSIAPIINHPEELKKFTVKQLKDAKEYQTELRVSTQKGMEIRQSTQPYYPPAFYNGDIYLKIPSLASTMAQLNKMITTLNKKLPESEHLTLLTEDVNGQTKYQIKSAQKEQYQSVARFLSAEIKRLNEFYEILENLPDDVFEAFKKEFVIQQQVVRKIQTDGTIKTYQWMRNFRKKYNLPAAFNLDNTLFLLFKSEISSNLRAITLDAFKKARAKICDTLELPLISLNFEQTKKQKGKKKAQPEDIDLIIFSNRPLQIARMSAYVSWSNESCMAPNCKMHSYTQQDIGHGTIIAYGVNSSNPRRKLARILLKPYRDNNGNVIYNCGTVRGALNKNFKDFVAKWSAEHFDNPADGQLFLRDTNLYDDSEPESIVLSDNIAHMCDFLNIPYEIKRIDTNDIFVIKGDFSSVYMPQDFDFSNCIIQGKFKVSSPLLKPKKLPLYAHHLEIDKSEIKKQIDLSAFPHVTITNSRILSPAFIPPMQNLTLNNTSIFNTHTLDLSECQNVALNDCSLHNTSVLIAPQNHFICRGVNAFDLFLLDLSTAKSTKLSNVSMKNLKFISVPEQNLILEGTPLTNIVEFDFGNCQNVEIKGVSLRNKQIIPPANFIDLSDCQLTGNVDLSECQNARLNNADMRGVTQFIPPQKSLDLTDSRWMCAHLDLSGCKHINITNIRLNEGNQITTSPYATVSGLTTDNIIIVTKPTIPVHNFNNKDNNI